MKKIYSLLSLLFVLTFANQSYASHAMGGEISYVCLGGNQYEVTLKFYRDCAGISAPVAMSLHFENSCGYTVNPVNLNPIVNNPTLVSYVCPTQLTTCNGGTFLGIEEWTYTGVITLPGPCNDWKIYHSENARNSAITTITGGGVEDLFIYATINNAQGVCNSSPQFEQRPQSLSCVGQFTCLSNSVFDPDGDSLYYELVTPMAGNTTPVTYLSGYSYLQPLLSSPPATFNNATGTFCSTAQQSEVTVMAIKVSEFRNGVLVGTTVRDFQLNIVQCSNSLPFVTGLNYSPFTVSADVCVGVETCFSIASFDPDPQSTQLFFNSGYQGLTITETNGILDSATLCFNPLPGDTVLSPLTITVTVRDNHCPYIGTFERKFTFNIINDASCVTSIVESKTNTFHSYLMDGNLLSVELESIPGNAELTVFDLAGKAVFRSHVNGRSNTFDLGKLSSGLYIVGITDGARKFRPQKLLLY